LIYDASAFDNEIFRYLPAATLVCLLFDCAAGVAAFYLVFHRLRFNRWLARETTKAGTARPEVNFREPGCLLTLSLEELKIAARCFSVGPL